MNCLTLPARFGKTSVSMLRHKASFFSANEAHHQDSQRLAELYARQPARTQCKLCEASLGAPDFVKLGVGAGKRGRIASLRNESILQELRFGQIDVPHARPEGVDIRGAVVPRIRLSVIAGIDGITKCVRILISAIQMSAANANRVGDSPEAAHRRYWASKPARVRGTVADSGNFGDSGSSARSRPGGGRDSDPGSCAQSCDGVWWQFGKLFARFRV